MFKIVCIALICAVIIVYLKSSNSELTLPATIGSGILIIYLAVNYAYENIQVFKTLIDLTGVSSYLFKIIFKITSIGYLVEFAAGTIEDFGLKSISDKLVFAGKIIIIGVSMPIIYAIVNLLTGLII